jgi:peptide/nickel transport system permease protein
MSIQFVLLWSDALLFVLIAAIVALVLWARRQDALRAAWSRVAKDGVAMAAATVLAAFILVGLLDSLHYRALLPAQPGAAARYAVEVNSALDALLSDLRQRAEKTYSAPLATRLYSKEALENSTQREFPRLKHGGAHLGSDLSGQEFDIAIRVSRGCAGGLVVWLLLAAAWCRLRGVGVVEMLKVGAGGTAIRAVTLTLLPILLLLGIAISLGGGYHVFGTDKVGQDVLYLSLKSIRTGLLIGTLTTLVMLPLAVLLGILAGYVGGWVDDVIQYLYTTLSSIPGVLLIAAAVLMMQVIIDTHPEWFATSAERADARLLALCLILGMTSWTGVAAPAARRDAEAARTGIRPGGAGLRRRPLRHHGPPHPAQPDAHRADRAGDGFLRPGVGRGGPVLRRRRRRSEHHFLRHHDQHGAHGTGARAHGLVVAGGRLRLHVRPGAGGQPVRRRRARRL